MRCQARPRDAVARTTVLFLLATATGYSAAPLAAQEPPPSIAPPVGAYLDSALSIMERNVLGGDTVDWRAFRDSLYGWAAGAEEPADLYAAIRRALRALNPHSFLQLSAVQSSREAERRPQPAANASRSPGERPVHSPFSGRQSPEGALDAYAGHRIGRIAIPAFGAGHLTAFADSIETHMRSMEAQGACGWIVDLRGNGGGNMWPMLAGIGPLLGGEVIGHFQGRNGDITGTWFYRDGVTGIEGPDGEVMEVARVGGPVYRIEDVPPVAVLFDGGTGSSGEAVAIAFIGRPNTRSFGVPSYGFTTSNDGFRLPDSANMVLTVGVDADRNRVAYPTALVPDEVVAIAPDGVIPHTPPAEDPQLAAAHAWLARQPECRDG